MVKDGRREEEASRWDADHALQNRVRAILGKILNGLVTQAIRQVEKLLSTFGDDLLSTQWLDGNRWRNGIIPHIMVTNWRRSVTALRSYEQKKSRTSQGIRLSGIWIHLDTKMIRRK